MDIIWKWIWVHCVLHFVSLLQEMPDEVNCQLPPTVTQALPTNWGENVNSTMSCDYQVITAIPIVQISFLCPYLHHADQSRWQCWRSSSNDLLTIKCKLVPSLSWCCCHCVDPVFLQVARGCWQYGSQPWGFRDTRQCFSVNKTDDLHFAIVISLNMFWWIDDQVVREMLDVGGVCESCMLCTVLLTTITWCIYIKNTCVLHNPIAQSAKKSHDYQLLDRCACVWVGVPYCDGGALVQRGLVRGFRSGILTRVDYLNLVQCETVDGEYYQRLCGTMAMTSNTIFRARGIDQMIGLCSIDHPPPFSSPSLIDLKVQLQATDYGNFLQ